MGKRPRSHSPGPRPLSDLFSLPELFLHVLSFLSPNDLARLQAVNTQWERMVTDPQLWKRLYLQRYNHPHQSRLVYTPGRSTPMRPIARLPSRAFPPPSPSPSETDAPEIKFDGVDWKALLRLGTNWSKGHVLSQASVALPSPAPTQEESAVSSQHLALFPSFIVASSPSSPLVHVYSPDGVSLGLIPPPPGWSSPTRPDNVSAIVADQAVTSAEGNTERYLPARLGIFYSSGGFAILRLRLASARLVWVRESVVDTARVRIRRRHSNGNDPVVLASLHFPLLVTCTHGFNLAVYTLGPQPTLQRTLRSDVSFHPASLSLLPTSAGFRCALTFATPVYPASWTVAVQELSITTGSSVVVHRGICHHVHARWDKESWPARIEPIAGVRGPIGVGSDGRWCVLAGQDNVIHVYALPAESEDEVGISYAETLLAPSGGVGALALNAGRCVSGGGGKVLVWELDSLEEGVAGEARVGMARGKYVEVCPKTQAEKSTSDVDNISDSADISNVDKISDVDKLPNPRSISSAARSLFLAPPPAFLLPSTAQSTHNPETLSQLAFDEEKIVGMVGDVMRIWSFR